MSSCVRIVAGLAAGCLIGLGFAAPAAQAASACPSANARPAQLSERTLVRATLCVLNAERDRHGLRPLSLDPRLSTAARRHARDMATRNYFSHTSLDGSSFVDRIRRAGYLRGARSWAVAENIAWGSGGLASPKAIGRSWMQSPGHRANILSRSYRELGVGVAGGAPVAGVGGATTYSTSFGSRS
jgi:uncharacterized protein YkwD